MKSPPLKIGSGLLTTKGKIEVIVCSENLSGVHYNDWQSIGQGGWPAARLNFAQIFPIFKILNAHFR
jgi:hypothetical protein